MTRLLAGLYDPESEFRQEQKVFLLSKTPRPAREVPVNLLFSGHRGYFLGVMQAEREADLSPPSCAEAGKGTTLLCYYFLLGKSDLKIRVCEISYT